LQQKQHKTMKILIVEDKPEQQKRALEATEGHDTIVVKNYEEAIPLLHGRWVPDETPRGCHWVKEEFDVVLTDLMLPATGYEMSYPERFIGQEMPFGAMVVLLALKSGVRKIGLITDINHHNHPMSAALDPFCDYQNYYNPVVFGDFALCVNQGKNWADVFWRLTNPPLDEETHRAYLEQRMKG
jgi:CheY-like chemotaxis protein